MRKTKVLPICMCIRVFSFVVVVFRVSVCVCVRVFIFYKKVATLHTKRNVHLNQSAQNGHKTCANFSLLLHLLFLLLLIFYIQYFSKYFMHSSQFYKSFAKVIYKLFHSEVLTVTGYMKHAFFFWVFLCFLYIYNFYIYIYIYMYAFCI